MAFVKGHVMIKVGIVGGTGYTGVELLRLLAQHPQAEVTVITSRSEAGLRVDEMYPNLRGHYPDLAFSVPDVATLGACDVVFFATPHGVAHALAGELLAAGTRVIDLSADFRLQDAEEWAKWYGQPHGAPELLSEAVYGLPEVYGAGALPVNYPNALDRARGRTGYGIWLHGVPRTTYSRTPRASEGCVVIANDDFESIRDHVDVGTTPVIMTTGIDWVPAADVEAQRTALLSAVESWRHSWQAIDTKSYLTYYAPDFVSDDGRDKAAFATYKKQINASKTNITVDLSDISIFRYPGEDRMMKVTFNQNYTSNNYHAEDRKTQYWQQNDDGQWQIVLETEKD